MATTKKSFIRYIFLLTGLCWVTTPPAQAQSQGTSSESGVAMYYADYLHGQSTALGEIYSKYELTCSHPYQPKGTLLRVTRLDNNKSVTVRVNDRGTFEKNVIIYLSWAAAMELDLVKSGKAWVTVDVVGYSNLNPVNPNRDALLERNVTSYDNPPSSTGQFTVKGGDRVSSTYGTNLTTPKGATNSTFQWDSPPITTMTARSPYTPDNYETTSFSAPRSGYGIQVGSYALYDNAERQVNNLRKTGVNNLFIKESVNTNGDRLYRVMIGAFESRNEATNYLESLRQNYICDGIVMNLAK